MIDSEPTTKVLTSQQRDPPFPPWLQRGRLCPSCDSLRPAGFKFLTGLCISCYERKRKAALETQKLFRAAAAAAAEAETAAAAEADTAAAAAAAADATTTQAHADTASKVGPTQLHRVHGSHLCRGTARVIAVLHKHVDSSLR